MPKFAKGLVVAVAVLLCSLFASAATIPPLTASFTNGMRVPAGNAQDPVLASEISSQQPGHLELVGQVGGTARGLDVPGGFAYIGVGPRVVVLDIADPASLVQVGQTEPFHGLVQRLVSAGRYLIAATRDAGVRIIDVADPRSPREVAAFDTPAPAWCVAAHGSLLYVDRLSTR
jgi:hypothetical protein